MKALNKLTPRRARFTCEDPLAKGIRLLLAHEYSVFLGRICKVIAIRYHAKLKSQGAPQLCSEPQMLSVVDDLGKGE